MNFNIVDVVFAVLNYLLWIAIIVGFVIIIRAAWKYLKK